jgi:hypothetical protein
VGGWGGGFQSGVGTEKQRQASPHFSRRVLLGAYASLVYHESLIIEACRPLPFLPCCDRPVTARCPLCISVGVGTPSFVRNYCHFPALGGCWCSRNRVSALLLCVSNLSAYEIEDVNITEHKLS